MDDTQMTLYALAGFILFLSVMSMVAALSALCPSGYERVCGYNPNGTECFCVEEVIANGFK